MTSALLSLDAVLFDFDGVLVESTDLKTAAFRTLFSDRPADLDAIVALHERHAGISRMIKFDMIYRDILRRPLPAAEKARLAERFNALVFEKVVACPMVPGAAALLEKLAGRVPMAIVSGTPEDELVRIVAQRGLAKCFTAIKGSPRGKRDIIRDLLTGNRWRATNALMIGDAGEDRDAALANDVAFIGRVAPGRSSPFPARTPVVADLTEIEVAVAAAERKLATTEGGAIAR